MTNRFLMRLAGVCAGLTGAAALLPGAASAQIVELGQTATPITAPTCVSGQPLSSCTILLTRTTAITATSDGIINPTRVNQQGWIVAFTVGLSRLSSSRGTEASLIKSADGAYGGAPSLALTVLTPKANNTFAVDAESAVYTLTPFLGQVLQEPLSLPPTFTTLTALHVERGEVIGLTTPTWAPVLDYQLSKTAFSYRQSRSSDCSHTAPAQTAQTRLGSSATYGCYYTGTRPQYSVTEITDTSQPRTYVGDAATRR